MKKLLPDRPREKPQIVLTNLIDVILLLVFFFMITSSFARDTKKIPLNLPKAGTATAVEGDTLIFQVDAEGRILSGGKLLDQTQISSKVVEYLGGNAERPLIIEADEAVNYGKVIGLLDLIRSSGGTNLGLSTKLPNAKR